MEFAARISVTCFAASYAVSVAAEVVRLFWPKALLRWVAIIFAYAGILAQFLFLLAISWANHHLPIATQFESLLTVSWLIALIYAYLQWRDPKLAAGIFILPVSLALALYARAVVHQIDPDSEGARHVIGVAHGSILLFATVLVVLALAVSIMYLIKVRQIKEHTGVRLKLPSLERLDYLHSVFVYVAYGFLTIGIVLAFCLQFTHSALGWTDPKLLTTVLSWGVFTLLVHYRHHPEHRGRRLAILTLVACSMVLLTVLGDPLFGTAHQRPPVANGGAP